MLDDEHLLLSEIVANVTMNRGRGLSGVNSYARELRFDILEFLAERVRQHGRAVWYDACCGEGRALVEAGERLAYTDREGRVQIFGVDLAGMFLPERAPGVTLVAADVARYLLDRPADLITCVHGLHYLGDKLGFLQNAYEMLAPGGLLIGSFDADNVRLAGSRVSAWRPALRLARKSPIALKLKNHLLRIERTDAPLNFGTAYQGATVSEKPNSAGITVIDSWYEY